MSDARIFCGHYSDIVLENTLRVLLFEPFTVLVLSRALRRAVRALVQLLSHGLGSLVGYLHVCGRHQPSP